MMDALILGCIELDSVLRVALSKSTPIFTVQLRYYSWVGRGIITRCEMSVEIDRREEGWVE